MAATRRWPASVGGLIRARGPQLSVLLLAIVTLLAVDLVRENRVLRTRVRWHLEREIAAAEPEPSPSTSPAETLNPLPEGEEDLLGAAQPAAKPDPTVGDVRADPVAAAVTPRPEDAEWPAIGQLLRGFGWHWSPTYGDYRFHAGIDLQVASGTDVRAALPGKVESAGRERLWAYRVVLDHGGGLQTVYAHLGEVYVVAGEGVMTGQALGRIGPPGEAELADGVALHFEMRKDGHPVDPESYLR